MNELESKFAQTIKQNKSTIYTVCYMFSKDADEVNDLFQEAVINMWRGFEGFENRSNVKTWIYRVTLNTCISQERKKRRTDAEPLTMDINLFEDRDEDTRQVDMLHERISRLQPFDRAIVLLWLENMPYEEIGQVVGISTTAVATRTRESDDCERPFHPPLHQAWCEHNQQALSRFGDCRPGYDSLWLLGLCDAERIVSCPVAHNVRADAYCGGVHVF